MRRACHSSHKPRKTAASVSSRPRLSRASPAVSTPSLSSAFHNSSTSGETLWPEDFCGACFQSASARRESTNGSASLWARKSGCSLTEPNRFSATTLPEAMRRVSRLCACAMASAEGVAWRLPMQASTNEGAGAGNCACLGRKRHKGCWRHQFCASSSVRRGLWFWRQCAARAAWSCSAIKKVPFRAGLYRLPDWKPRRWQS
jgi:hypothetical protein